MLTLRIAWRNIFRHKGKTAVIGVIIFLGTFIMTVGSGVLSGLNAGLEKNIVRSFSGDAVLISTKQLNESVLASMSGQTMEPITQYDDLKPKLTALPAIADLLPVGIGYVWVLNETGLPIDQYILGVNFQDYRRFFGHNFSAVEGRLLKPNEKGVMVSTTMRNMLYDYSGNWMIPEATTLNTQHLSREAKQEKNLKTKQSLVFLGLSEKNTSLDIALPVIGIIKFKALNSILGFYSIVDIDSLRECMGYFTSSAPVQLSESEKTLLESDVENLDSLLDTSIETAKQSKVEANIPLSRGVPEGRGVSESAKQNDGVFNAILVRFKPETPRDTAIAQLKAHLKKEHIPLKVVSWNKAIGIMGQMAIVMKGALWLFVGFIFFVAIMIIMNTLSMAAMERTEEIGMMRAVGARKSFITKMFLAETVVLSGFFGVLGIIAGMGCVILLKSLHLSTDNEFLQILYGGDILQPRLSPVDIAGCLVMLAVITIVSVLYPVWAARRTTALDAITKE